MAEETKDPVRNFPKMMLTGLGITGVIYVLVAIFAVALVPVAELGEGDTPLTKVVSAGLPDFPIDKVMPFIAMFAVANSALINMLMASRLLYGMARQDVLPPAAGLGAQGPADPVGGDHLHHDDRLRPDLLRQHERQPRRVGPGWHHGPAAARRLHDRQHRGAGAAPRPDRPRPLRHPHGAAVHRGRGVLLLHPAGHRARRRSSTRSRPGCSASAWCSGRSPGSPTGSSSARRPTCATPRSSPARTPPSTSRGAGPVDSRTTSSVGSTIVSFDSSSSSRARSSRSAAAWP